MLIGSVFGNLNWFNAIALLSVFEQTTMYLFAHTLWNFWIIDIVAFAVCTAIVVTVNIKVKNKANDV